MICISLLCLLLALLSSSSMKMDPYDKMVNVFSDKGELLQVEYARKAGMLGDPILCGVSAVDNEIVVCVPTSKQKHILLDHRSIDKISKIDPNFFLGFSGLGGDGQALVNTMREKCVVHKIRDGFPSSLSWAASKISKLQHKASLQNNRRPFGLQTLLLGRDAKTNKMEIYLIDPSGSYFLSLS
jgi:20S proteasome subunit alpha 4